MIEEATTQAPSCHHCHSSHTIRHGYTRKGKQRYRCHTCARSFVRDPGTAAYDPARKEEILRAYHERASLRGLSRIFGVSRNTVTRWLKKADSLPPLEQTLAPAAQREEEVLELDEVWSFVRQRKNKRWIWLALCRRTRQEVAYAIGNRGGETCRLLWERVPESYRRGILYSDFWESYQKVLPEDQHQPMGKSSGQTNHVERWNCTLRQRLGGFVRKTLSFSKSEAMHEICLVFVLA
jgi:insertion element IS1 protein InsB